MDNKSCRDFTADLILALLDMSYVRELSHLTPNYLVDTRRLHREEMEEFSTAANVFRQKHGHLLPPKALADLQGYITGITKADMSGHFDTTSMLSEKAIRLLAEEAIPIMVKCNCQGADHGNDDL